MKWDQTFVSLYPSSQLTTSVASLIISDWSAMFAKAFVLSNSTPCLVLTQSFQLLLITGFLSQSLLSVALSYGGYDGQIDQCTYRASYKFQVFILGIGCLDHLTWVKTKWDEPYFIHPSHSASEPFVLIILITFCTGYLLKHSDSIEIWILKCIYCLWNSHSGDYR
jgi:hypothetical protein